MDDAIERHIKLKKKIDRLKAEKSKLDGMYESATEEIKDEYDCDDVDELSQKIDDSERELKRLKKIIPPMVDELEEKLDGLDGD